MTSRIEQLNYASPGRLEYAAGRLVTLQISRPEDEGGYDIDEAVERFIAEARDKATHAYALIDTELGLIAAATVAHGSSPMTASDGTERTSTEILTLAVQPNLQERGYGREMVRFIAAQALSHGDHAVVLFAIDPEPYRRMGFEGDEYDFMWADPGRLA